MDYLAEFLCQVMGDEFDIQLEDGSAEEVAARIVGLRSLTRNGDFRLVEEMRRRFLERRDERVEFIQGKGAEGEEDYDDDDNDDGDDDGEGKEDWNGFDEMDVDQPQASSSVVPAAAVQPQRRQKVEPIVDEDGFTKVVGKKNR